VSTNDRSSARNHPPNFLAVYSLTVFAPRSCCFLGGVLDACLAFPFLTLVSHWTSRRTVNAKATYLYANHYHREGPGKDLEIDPVPRVSPARIVSPVLWQFPRDIGHHEVESASPAHCCLQSLGPSVYVVRCHFVCMFGLICSNIRSARTKEQTSRSHL
jgi:hypothetical protein